MKKIFLKKFDTQKGAAMMMLVFFFMFVSITLVAGIVTPVVREFRVASDSLASRQTYFLSESGVEDAMYRIKKGKPIGSSATLVLGSASAVTTVSDMGYGKKQIVSLGDTNLRQRKVGVVMSTDAGISFNYGVQVGQGGFSISGSSAVNGNIYSNGPITGDSSSFITGSAIAANSPANAADQSNGTGVPAYNMSAGNAAGSDIAQSFKVSTTAPLSKIQLYIKKVGAGTPYNTTVYILPDNSGSPGFGTIAQATLSSSLVTSSYGWVDVVFPTNPVLTAGTRYWIVFTVTTSANYYMLGANNAGYADGQAKVGSVFGSWSNTSPSGLDTYFTVGLGEANGLIAGSSGSQWNQLHIGTSGSGKAQAHTVNYANTPDSLYCKVGTGNNKTCDVSVTDPSYVAFPISDGNIDQWKTDAAAGGTISGDYSVGWAGATLGPKKITGNLSVSGGGTLTVTGAIWVTGKITLNGGGLIKLSSGYGANDGILISDGGIEINGGGHATGSGTAGSYIMMITTMSGSAASINGGAGAVILYVPNGTLDISGGASLKEATAYRITMSGGSSVTYESGLADLNFSSGPSGTWSISSWKETE